MAWWEVMHCNSCVTSPQRVHTHKVEALYVFSRDQWTRPHKYRVLNEYKFNVFSDVVWRSLTWNFMFPVCLAFCVYVILKCLCTFELNVHPWTVSSCSLIFRIFICCTPPTVEWFLSLRSYMHCSVWKSYHSYVSWNFFLNDCVCITEVKSPMCCIILSVVNGCCCGVEQHQRLERFNMIIVVQACVWTQSWILVRNWCRVLAINNVFLSFVFLSETSVSFSVSLG